MINNTQGGNNDEQCMYVLSKGPRKKNEKYSGMMTNSVTVNS